MNMFHNLNIISCQHQKQLLTKEWYNKFPQREKSIELYFNLILFEYIISRVIVEHNDNLNLVKYST